MADSARMQDTAQALATVPDSAWHRLAERRIVFGHQSVGRNILDGVRSLIADQPGVPLHLASLTTAGGGTLPAGAFVDLEVGRNSDPLSKTRDFAAAVDSGLARPGGIALHKYCYVDFDGANDPDSVFSAYRAAMAELRLRHPEVTLVHVTTPVRTDITRWKDRVKYLLGRETGRDHNVRRNRFNHLLLQAYRGVEPVFDLARLEATAPDGRLSHFVHQGDTVLTLARAWSSDGGHLNPAGQRWVAAHLLRFLAELP